MLSGLSTNEDLIIPEIRAYSLRQIGTSNPISNNNHLRK